MGRKLKAWSGSANYRSFELNLLVHGIKGLTIGDGEKRENYSIILQIQWKGRRNRAGYRSKSVRNTTATQCVQGDGSVNWNESFDHICKLKFLNTRCSSSWDIHLEVHGLAQDSDSRTSVLGKVMLDLAEFVTLDCSKRTIQIPVCCNVGGSTMETELTMTLALSEIKTKRRTMITRAKSLFSSGGSCKGLSQIDDGSQFVISRGKEMAKAIEREAEKQNSSEYDGTSDCRFTPEQSKELTGTESSSSSSSEEEPEFGYGNIAETNLLVGIQIRNQEGDRIESREGPTSASDCQTAPRATLFNLLSWKTASFRGSYRHKGIPLLKKDCEHGGDDIDDDRRNQPNQQSASSSPSKIPSPTSGFDDDNSFEVGSWEKKLLVSRDGQSELFTSTFFASVDQCSEKVAGDGACAVLVAVIADWLHRNKETLPLKCQFDQLIREGSLEWRKLCENETHMERFSDKHFDIDTVLEAKVRPLSVVSEMSYIGFFVPDDMTETFDFLEGAMSFDSIWEELVNNVGPEGSVYIVSWNDHFFLLKVEMETIYLIDTLGERLHEGCNQAFMLKFDKDTTVYGLQPGNPDRELQDTSDSASDQAKAEKDADLVREIISQGRTSCKAFIKKFLAALPLRELQVDMKKGLVREDMLHRRLQIEFHYTSLCD
ncbi:uncharacterized protein LOC116253996 [Nymphaea colorata]|nr:uncharacterized protein LOC116253996 [Nymphaea colorata]XP_031484867.1 uncharacterized protein LOC116253996 [Nymphaea colorata]